MRALLCVLLAVCSFSAMAAPAAIDKRPLVHLDASASREVLEDTAHAILFVEKEHESATLAQQQVTKILSGALIKAKAVQGLTVKTGQLSSQPVYGKDERIQVWRVRGELVLESKNAAALSDCVSTLTHTMSIENMWFSLSTAARQKVQESLQAEAIAAFMAKAKAAAHQFDYRRYTLADVRISSGGVATPVLYARAPSIKSKAMAESVPMEAGKSTVTVSVSGSVRLEK